MVLFSLTVTGNLGNLGTITVTKMDEFLENLNKHFWGGKAKNFGENYEFSGKGGGSFFKSKIYIADFGPLIRALIRVFFFSMKMIKKGLFLCMGLYQGIGWVIWKFSDGPVIDHYKYNEGR